VEIYNRWGQMLWHVSPGISRFRGMVATRVKNLPVGTYYYLIRSDNFEQPFTGPITIVR
jgi:hypothetical protein